MPMFLNTLRLGSQGRSLWKTLCLVCLSKASVTFRLELTPRKENPSRVFGTGPAGIPKKPQFSTPSRCSSTPEKLSRPQVSNSARPRDVSGRPFRPSRVIWHLDLQSMPQNRETVAETTPFSGVTALLWRLCRLTHLGPNEQTTLSEAKKRATYSLNAVLDTKPSKFFPERVRTLRYVLTLIGQLIAQLRAPESDA